MEAVSAVAGIVGITGFTGQAINGLQKLYNFFEDCRNASKTADRFLREANSLTDALKDVEAFMTKAQALPDALNGTTALASLSISVEDCSRDIKNWVKEAERMSSSLGGSNSRLKKFLVAVKKQGMNDVFEQIGSHKSTITLSLSAIGRLLDAYNCSQSDVLVAKVGEATSYGKVTVEALSRLESMMETPKRYEQDAIRTSESLSSIASAVSRIESMFSQKFAASTVDQKQPGLGNSHSPNVEFSSEASRLADEKRKRNEGASQRFRQRRKEKEEEAKRSIEKMRRHNEDLERKVQEVDQMTEFYRTERDRYRDLVYSNPETSHLSNHLATFRETVPISMEYVRLSLSIQHIKGHLRMQSALVDNLDCADPELEESHLKAKQRLTNEMIQLRACRIANWDAGHDLEGLERILGVEACTDNGPYCVPFEGESSSGDLSKPWWDILHHTISQTWITKTDRINSWLLQNLAAVPEEAERHRMFIPEGEKLGEEQWARLVLKFWPIDEAAPKFEQGVCSTNGAVNSAGACHSVRVLLAEMPFDVRSEDEVMENPLPIRWKRNMSEGSGSDISRTAKKARVEDASESP